MRNIVFFLMLVVMVFSIACQRPEVQKKQTKKANVEQQKKSKAQPKKNKTQPKQQTNAKNPKTNSASTKTAQKGKKQTKGKKRKQPNIAEQQKALGLTDVQVKEIQAANDAAKKARGIIRNRNNGKINKQDNVKINNTKENRLKQKLGIVLYNKRKQYIESYKSK